jgi:hypothetical protein
VLPGEIMAVVQAVVVLQLVMAQQVPQGLAARLFLSGK